MNKLAIMLGVVVGSAAHAKTVTVTDFSESCLEVQETDAAVTLRVHGKAKLVVRLQDPPRSRVMLSVDNDKGNHYELVWDPAVNDGLQHEVVLPQDVWVLTPSSEHERVQAEKAVYTYATVFAPPTIDTAAKEIVFAGKNTSSVAGASDVFDVQGKPMLRAACKPARVEMSQLHLDRRKVEAVAKARGLLDARVPEPVTSALSLLAEIAVDRAKSGAMELVREKFVIPICNSLKLETLGLGGSERLLPNTCTLAEQLRLQDVLGSGRALLTALEADVRDVIVPALLDKLPSLDEQTRALARTAFKFASRAIEGQLDGIVEIDYLVALLDQLPWLIGIDDASVVEDWLVQHAKASMSEIQRLVVSATLPASFETATGPWNSFDDCKRIIKATTISGVGLYQSPSRRACVDAIVEHFSKVPARITRGAADGYYSMQAAIGIIRAHTRIDLATFVQRRWEAELSSTRQDVTSFVRAKTAKLSAPERVVFETSCAARLVVAVTKWCSSRESCSAGEISGIIRDPKQLLAPSTQLPWALCWEGETYRMPANIDPYIDLGARLVTFLMPPNKGEERQRIIALIRWMFDAVIALGGDDKQLTKVHDVVKSLLEKDYVTAMTRAVDVAVTLRCDPAKPESCRPNPAATRALQLMGSIASYAHVYEQTKRLDANAARDERRKALESMIDAATDRRGRGGDTVWSFGSNVGVGFTWNDLADKWSSDDKRELSLRLPLGISVQWLPWGSTDKGIYHVNRRFSLHGGLQLADLGQFAREHANDVTWASFVSPGFELGVLYGEPHRTINLTVHGSYAPALSDDEPPVWRYGISLGYYVPFFDFN